MSFEIQQITASALAVDDKRLVSNVGAILMKDFIVMVDAGMRPDMARLLRRQLEDQFSRPVKYLCLTHYHADHAFSLSAFKDVTILGSTEVAENLKKSPDWSAEKFAEGRKNDPDGGKWVDEVEFILPSLLFTGRLELLDSEKTLQFNHSGGHTSCSVYATLPSEKVLFAADLIFSNKLPYAGDPSFDPERWMEVLKSWLEMDIEHVIPGHGPITGLEEVRRHLVFFETLKKNTLAALQAGKGPEEIVLPDLPAGEGQGWGVKKTLQQWHNYYLQKM